MIEIEKNLYQFSVYIPPMDFTIHQYLLNMDPAILFAAGTAQQAASILPDLKKVLGDKPLKYVFVSHMESDEAGGIAVLKNEWPDIVVICGELAARELPGYGYQGEVAAEHGDEERKEGELDLSFIDYPAEVHLQNGLLCYERNSGILYSSDLFLRYGNGVGKTIAADWKDEVGNIAGDRIPNDEMRKKVQDQLSVLKPRFVAVGHGFCLGCR